MRGGRWRHIHGDETELRGQGRLPLEGSALSLPWSETGHPPRHRQRAALQSGYPGHTLEQVRNPDHQESHPLRTCPGGLCRRGPLENDPVLDR